MEPLLAAPEDANQVRLCVMSDPQIPAKSDLDFHRVLLQAIRFLGAPSMVCSEDHGINSNCFGQQGPLTLVAVERIMILA